MKIPLYLLLLVLILSCADKSNGKVSATNATVKDIETWLYYERDSIDWAADYAAFDTSSIPISKGSFLEQLTSGKYIPLKIPTLDSQLSYKLYTISELSDKSLGEIIKNKALAEYYFYKMEGQPLPDFDFVDLKGTAYNKNTMKDKLLVIKCWFISCVPCVAEMPDLNKLVADYADKKEVTFISLAFDKADDLKKFLIKTKFDYRVVPEKEDYMINVLKISAYPTHILVDANGLIIKMSNEYQDIFNALNKKL
jgi:thiol-disulfide isomerase/thioredoxin